MKSSNAEKERILIIEDEPGIRRVCRRTLIGEGYQVDIAPNGDIAEEMLMEEDYDLLLIDIRTPGVNGRQLYQYIQERYPKVIDKVIFTTGDVVSDDVRHFLEQTGKPFLLKPFTPDELRTIVRETLSRLH